jgi:predicted membrane channel-forming protein YqfA (hemolysin III family)
LEGPSKRHRPLNVDRHGATLVEIPLHFMEEVMNGIIYLVGLIVVIMAILSFLGLR